MNEEWKEKSDGALKAFEGMLARVDYKEPEAIQALFMVMFEFVKHQDALLNMVIAQIIELQNAK